MAGVGSWRAPSTVVEERRAPNLVVNVTADPRFAERQAQLIAERARSAVSLFGLGGVPAGVA